MGLITAAMLVAALAAAPQDAEPDPVAERTINIVVYGEDSCPKPRDEEEIVVCARRPESERYRVPKPLRDREPTGAVSWITRNEELDEASRPSRPGSCSVVGSYGQAGCFQQIINQWFRARRNARR